jgi:hypothetical protein
VARKERAMIQKGQRDIVLKNLEAGHAAANDVTEDAVFLEHLIEMGFENGGMFHRISYLGICLP